MHGALLVLREAERGFAEGAGEGGEEMSGAGFVIPDVRAIAEAAAVVIVDTLEAVEFAVGGAEGGGGAKGGEIRHGRFKNRRGKRGLTDGVDEKLGLLFETREVLSGVFGGGPSVGKFGGVPVADDGILFAFRGVPAAVSGRAIGEMPGEEEFVIG